MKNQPLLLIVFLAAISFASCRKTANVTPSGSTPDTSKTGTGSVSTGATDVYVVGSEADVVGETGQPQACYWKNGTKTLLPGAATSTALSIVVSGSDVYISGFLIGTPEIPAIWKNGQLISLGGAQNSRAGCLAAYNGTVYAGFWTFTYSKLTATTADYLKFSGTQSTESALPDANNHPIVYSMAASATDLYTAGTGLLTFTSSFSAYIPVYWINSEEHAFTFPTDLGSFQYRSGVAYGITLSGTDVYAAGEADYTNSPEGGAGGSAPVLWKNNIGTILTKTAPGIWQPGAATGVAVSNGDVYVAGILSEDNGDVPVFWKNGVMSQLPKQHADAEPTGIFVSGSDVYISGNDGVDINTACYWKNGTQVSLTDGTKFAAANAIYVVQH